MSSKKPETATFVAEIQAIAPATDTSDLHRTGHPRPGLNLWVEVEKRADGMLQLCLDLLPAAFQDVHRHLRLVAVFQRHRGRLNARELIGGQKPHTVNQD